jgi:DeoR family transcriptional regulator of aga operon
MLVEERRAAILTLLREHGQVRVRELSHRFKTSEVTIRNDLKQLHQRGLVHKAHGGAVPPDVISVEPSLRERFRTHIEEKKRIGAAAAAMVRDSETIILDSGSTTQEIARHLRGRHNVQVITNGLNIANALVGVRGVRVILLGGVLRENSFSVVGHFAEEMLGHLTADKLFIAADGCDLTFGLSTPNLEESRVNQAMLKIARQKILVADSSKFGKTSLSRIASLQDMDSVLSDTQLPEKFRTAIAGYGIDLVLV